MEDKELQDCSCKIINKENVEKVIASMPDDETLYDLADFFKAFSDSTRIKILYALLQGELCVCDISTALNMTQSATSHQLRVLKLNRLVKSRRDGKIVYYSLDDEHVNRIFKEGFSHITE